jgi:hypothetical protein
MNTRAQAQYLRIFDESSTYARWQGYYANQTITWQSASWSYFPFTADGLLSASGSNGSDITVTVPATQTAITELEAAINFNRLIELRMYEFDSRLSQSGPQATQDLIGFYVGEAIKITGSFTTLQLKLGSSLSPVGAQVPPRNYTTLLVGAPIRL